MDHRLIEGLMEVVVPAVREYVDKATAPLIAQLAELRAREPIKGDPGEPGKSVTLDDIQPLIVRSLSEMPKPQDGKSVTLDDVKPLVEQAVAALPKPQDGKDGAPGERGTDGKDIDPAVVKLLVAEEVAKIPPASNGKDGVPGERGADGKDADPVLIEKLVTEAVAKIPVPIDGKDGAPGERGLDGKDADPAVVKLMVAEEVAKIPPASDGKDGVGLAGAVIDRDGELVVTLTDGTHRKLGTVVGKRGKDGFGFEHLEEEIEDDGRVLVRRFKRGDELKEFRHLLATVIDRGVWRPGAYGKGDAVSCGGSIFIAQRATEVHPENNKDDWRLSVKRGRDGKDLRPETPRDPPIIKTR